MNFKELSQQIRQKNIKGQFLGPTGSIALSYQLIDLAEEDSEKLFVAWFAMINSLYTQYGNPRPLVKEHRISWLLERRKYLAEAYNLAEQIILKQADLTLARYVSLIPIFRSFGDTRNALVLLEGFDTRAAQELDDEARHPCDVERWRIHGEMALAAMERSKLAYLQGDKKKAVEWLKKALFIVPPTEIQKRVRILRWAAVLHQSLAGFIPRGRHHQQAYDYIKEALLQAVEQPDQEEKIRPIQRLIKKRVPFIGLLIKWGIAI